MSSFIEDRQFIENKYHVTNEPFNPYERMAYHGYPYDESTGDTDEYILAGLQDMREELASLPHPIAKARAIQYVLEHTKIDVNEHDFFVGLYSVNRLANSVCLDVWLRELYEGKCKKSKRMMEELSLSNSAEIWPDFDHVIPDWNAILTLGFVGLRNRVETYREIHRQNQTLTPKMNAHFEGMLIEYDAIIGLIDRLYRYALTKTHAKASTIASCLDALKKGAPTNLFEAMQAMFLYFIISECFDSYQVRSLGNGLDHSLYPFYENDLKNGRYSREEIKEFFRYFLFQWSAIGNYWGQPFYLGGTNSDGSTRYNDISRLILEVYGEMGIYNPKIQVKINDNTPNDILYQVFSLIRKGQNCFAFCCEPAFMRAVKEYGATESEAYDFEISGCYESRIRANEVSSVTGYVNALKAIEYVFTNGYEEKLGKTYGVATGELSTFVQFEHFFQAVLTQWGKIIDTVMETANEYERYMEVVNPSLTYSATIEESLKRGKDAYQNGVKYNNSSILNCAFASLVDAVMAVKTLVYDKKITTLETFQKALKSNWVGYEYLHTLAQKCPHKYGNDDAETDEIAQKLAKFFADSVNLRPNARGGVYKANMHSAMQFVWQGQKMGATPDGRSAREETSKNGSPSVGKDLNGVTSLINSALKLRPYTYLESFCLDVMLHPSAVAGEDGLAVMKALLFSYLQNGGMVMQMNVFHADTLREAQRHPERYRNLQVRVCGWNVLWNNLSREEQNAYIARAENISE